MECQTLRAWVPAFAGMTVTVTVTVTVLQLSLE